MENRNEKKQKNKKLSLAVAIIVLILAVVGIVFLCLTVANLAKNNSKTRQEIKQLNEYLYPVAAVDPTPFDDISAADSEELLDVTLWSILSLDTTPDTYPYRDGFMIIPETDVEAQYLKMFGNDAKASLKHTTVQGYNYTFTYDESAKQYKIPITSLTPIYAPNVTDISRGGDSIVVRLEMIAYDSWILSDGELKKAQPDKVMKVTLRKIKDEYYIGAIQLVSKSRPEAVSQ